MRTLHFNNIDSTHVLYDWDEKIGSDWKSALEKLIEHSYTDNLVNFIEQIYLSGKEIYPNKNRLFKPFKCCSLKDVKLVIIDDHPFKSCESSGIGKGTINNSILEKDLPIELVRFRDCIYNTIYGRQYSITNFDNSLKDLADNDILFLNSSMTVGKEEDHKLIWRNFIRNVIKTINSQCENVVFLFMTKNNNDLYPLINKENHKIIINTDDILQEDSDIFLEIDKYIKLKYPKKSYILW